MEVIRSVFRSGFDEGFDQLIARPECDIQSGHFVVVLDVEVGLKTLGEEYGQSIQIFPRGFAPLLS